MGFKPLQGLKLKQRELQRCGCLMVTVLTQHELARRPVHARLRYKFKFPTFSRKISNKTKSYQNPCKTNYRCWKPPPEWWRFEIGWLVLRYIFWDISFFLRYIFIYFKTRLTEVSQLRNVQLNPQKTWRTLLNQQLMLPWKYMFFQTIVFLSGYFSACMSTCMGMYVFVCVCVCASVCVWRCATVTVCVCVYECVALVSLLEPCKCLFLWGLEGMGMARHKLRYDEIRCWDQIRYWDGSVVPIIFEGRNVRDWWSHWALAPSDRTDIAFNIAMPV
jgi:hypothetical protein